MRRAYSQSFKYQVIQRALELQDLNKVARENRLNSRIIYRWIKEYKQGKYEACSLV